MAKISNKQLAIYAADQLQDGSPVQEVSQKIAAYLVSERRSRDVLVFGHLLEQQMHNRGQTQVVLTSSYKISDDIKSQITQALQIKHPVFHEVIDSSVLGGVHASTLHSQLDLTIAGKLKLFKLKVNEE